MPFQFTDYTPPEDGRIYVKYKGELIPFDEGGKEILALNVSLLGTGYDEEGNCLHRNTGYDSDAHVKFCKRCGEEV